MSYTEPHDEGFGARIETSIKIMEEMCQIVKGAIALLDDKADEVEANQGILANRREHELVKYLIQSALDDDYLGVKVFLTYIKRLADRQPQIV